MCVVVFIAQCGCELTVAVRMDELLPLAPRPARPRFRVWLSLLMFLILLGVGLMWMFSGKDVEQEALSFWGVAVIGPLWVWMVAGFLRVVVFIGQQYAADAWNEAREVDRLQHGRRSQQILAAQFITQFHESGEPSSDQLDALLQGTQASGPQPSRQDGAPVLKSRLPGPIEEAPERVIRRVLTQLLVEVSQTLKPLPDHAPIALLMEIDSQLPESQLSEICRSAWREAGIRQRAIPVMGSGLAVVDDWLDQRIDDQAMLLVVAMQCAPVQPQGTAEVGVSLLLGNRLTQSVLSPIAYLHRPEQAQDPTPEALRYAMHQALEWAALQANLIEKFWRAGVVMQHEGVLTTLLTESAMSTKPDEGLCNLDALLGHAGRASPWLAIATATQTLQRGNGPQLIFSSERSVEAGLWATVLTPVPAPSE